jgi:hypothetical protein
MVVVDQPRLRFRRANTNPNIAIADNTIETTRINLILSISIPNRWLDYSVATMPIMWRESHFMVCCEYGRGLADAGQPVN